MQRAIRSCILSESPCSVGESCDSVQLGADLLLPGGQCGSMTVIRVTKAEVGRIFTKILNSFLRMTDKQGSPETQSLEWKQPSSLFKWGVDAAWQQFDVIGDFGEIDKQNLLAKLSEWSQKRSGPAGKPLSTSSAPAWSSLASADVSIPGQTVHSAW